MSVLSFFYRLKYGSYQQSHRSKFYEEIANLFNVSPQHVYELQHGKVVRTRLDGVICDELLARAFDEGSLEQPASAPLPLPKGEAECKRI